MEEKELTIKIKLKFKFLNKPSEIEAIKVDLENEFKRIVGGYLKNNVRVIGKVSNIKKDESTYGVFWELNL